MKFTFAAVALLYFAQFYGSRAAPLPNAEPASDACSVNPEACSDFSDVGDIAAKKAGSPVVDISRGW